jgi:hypothetical protein
MTAAGLVVGAICRRVMRVTDAETHAATIPKSRSLATMGLTTH